MSPSPEAGISPFQSVEAHCAVCEKEAQYNRLKSTLYSETKRDIDLRPVTVLWSKKVSPRVDPKLFYFWQCPYCFFTADHWFFQNPFKEGKISVTRFRKQYKKGLAAHPAYKDIGKLLSCDLHQEKSVFITGLKLNILACYQWEMVDEVIKGECKQVASYYLRMAWMLHDLRNNLGKFPAIRDEAQTLLQAVRILWPQFIPSEVSMLEKALAYYQLALTQSAAVNTILQEVNVRLIAARIHMKLKRLPEARKAIIECKARVQYYESLIRKKRSEESHFSSSDLQDMETLHGKCLVLVNSVELICDKIELTLLDRQVRAAEELLGPFLEKTHADKVQILQKSGFNEQVISKVLPKEKRKGLLGILKSS